MRKTPLHRYTSLKQKTPLKRKTRLKPQSEKAKAEAFIWNAVKKERAKLLIEKFGYLICEFCKQAIMNGQISNAHHANKNRRQNVVENARIVHRFPCHNEITDKNIIVPSLL